MPQIDRFSQEYGPLPPHGDPEPTHVPPPSHSSVAVQNSPSSHVVPSVSFDLMQTPDTHASEVQSLLSVHVSVSSFVETHAPLLQESSVHSLPSVHVLVSSFVKTHVPLSQVSSVHTFSSPQSASMMHSTTSITVSLSRFGKTCTPSPINKKVLFVSATRRILNTPRASPDACNWNVP